MDFYVYPKDRKDARYLVFNSQDIETIGLRVANDYNTVIVRNHLTNTKIKFSPKLLKNL